MLLVLAKQPNFWLLLRVQMDIQFLLIQIVAEVLELHHFN
jgi:hypothetical protein